MKLVTYSPAFGEPSASPFCVKAMILLEMTGQPWEAKFTGNPRKSPKGKLPVLLDGGKTIADSDVIRTYLEERLLMDFDAALDAGQRAVSRAVIRMTEEHIYFALVCNRWLDDNNWAVVRKVFFAGIPAILSGIVPAMVRKKVRAGMEAQGMGRHTPQEQLERVDKDISAITTLLGKQDFLFGAAPTAADASVVPMLRAIATLPTQTPLRERVTGDDRLMAYLERGAARLYPK